LYEEGDWRHKNAAFPTPQLNLQKRTTMNNKKLRKHEKESYGVRSRLLMLRNDYNGA
jgi:hypothetical protein